MILYYPLLTTIRRSLSSSIIVYKNNDVGISIEKWGLEDKKPFLRINGLKLFRNKLTSSSKSKYIAEFLLKNKEWLISNQAIKVNIPDVVNHYNQNVETSVIRPYREIINLITNLIIGERLMLEFLDTGEAYESKGLLFSDLNKGEAFTKKVEINKKIIDEISRIVKPLIEGKYLEKDNRLKLLVDLVEIICTSENQGLIGSFCITILESLYASKKSEGSYHLAMRLAKCRKKDLEFSDKVKVLYRKRNSMFHSGNNEFSSKDIDWLKIEVIQSICDYIKQPDNFQEKYFDKELLN